MSKTKPLGHNDRRPPHRAAGAGAHHQDKINNDPMDQVKIRRVKRNKKKATAKEKILAGLGVGGALMGGIGAVAPKASRTQFVRTQDQNKDSAKNKVQDLLKGIFGVETARADDTTDQSLTGDQTSTVGQTSTGDQTSNSNAGTTTDNNTTTDTSGTTGATTDTTATGGQTSTTDTSTTGASTTTDTGSAGTTSTGATTGSATDTTTTSSTLGTTTDTTTTGQGSGATGDSSASEADRAHRTSGGETVTRPGAVSTSDGPAPSSSAAAAADSHGGTSAGPSLDALFGGSKGGSSGTGAGTSGGGATVTGSAGATGQGAGIDNPSMTEAPDRSAVDHPVTPRQTPGAPITATPGQYFAAGLGDGDPNLIPAYRAASQSYTATPFSYNDANGNSVTGVSISTTDASGRAVTQTFQNSAEVYNFLTANGANFSSLSPAQQSLYAALNDARLRTPGINPDAPIGGGYIIPPPSSATVISTSGNKTPVGLSPIDLSTPDQANYLAKMFPGSTVVTGSYVDGVFFKNVYPSSDPNRKEYALELPNGQQIMVGPILQELQEFGLTGLQKEPGFSMTAAKGVVAQAAAPTLSFSTSGSSTSPKVGDTYTITITGAPGQKVYATGGPGGVNDTTPMGTIGADGTLVISGTFTAGDLTGGAATAWTETWKVGSDPASAITAGRPLSFTVNPTPAVLNFGNTAGGTALGVGNTWTINLQNANPNAPVYAYGGLVGGAQGWIYLGTTDASGNLQKIGPQLGNGDVGSWNVQIEVGDGSHQESAAVMTVVSQPAGVTPVGDLQKFSVAAAKVTPPAGAFTPSFMQDMRGSVVDGSGRSYNLNPADYATSDTAATLAQIYGGSVVSVPIPLGGPFRDPNQYFIKLPDGTMVNAGELATAYVSGGDQGARQAIASEQANFTANTGATTPDGVAVKSWSFDPLVGYIGTDAKGRQVVNQKGRWSLFSLNNNWVPLGPSGPATGGSGSGTGGSGAASKISQADATAFVTNLYNTVLYRQPDSAGLSGWVGALTGGTMTKDQVQTGITAAPEATQIAAFFQQLVPASNTTAYSSLTSDQQSRLTFYLTAHPTALTDQNFATFAPGSVFAQSLGLGTSTTLNDAAKALGFVRYDGANKVFTKQAAVITYIITPAAANVSVTADASKTTALNFSIVDNSGNVITPAAADVVVSSSDPTIVTASASASQINVTGQQAGSATVTIGYKGAMASFIVTVTAPSRPKTKVSVRAAVTDITLSKTSVKIAAGGGTGQVTATVNFDNGLSSNDVTVQSSSANVTATVDPSGVITITGVSDGSAVVTVHPAVMADDAGKDAAIKVQVTARAGSKHNLLTIDELGGGGDSGASGLTTDQAWQGGGLSLDQTPQGDGTGLTMDQLQQTGGGGLTMDQLQTGGGGGGGPTGGEATMGGGLTLDQLQTSAGQTGGRATSAAAAGGGLTMDQLQSSTVGRQSGGLTLDQLNSNSANAAAQTGRQSSGLTLDQLQTNRQTSATAGTGGGGIVAGVTPFFTTINPANGFIGQPYGSSIQAVSNYSMTYSLISGALPPGLSLSQSGQITGTPNAAGSYSFNVQATTSQGVSASKPFSLIVLASSAGSQVSAQGFGPGLTMTGQVAGTRTFQGLQMPAGYGASGADSASGDLRYPGLQMPATQQSAAQAQAQAQASQPQASYTVKKGDTLWKIAKILTGDGRNWRKILAANPDCLKQPGNTRSLKIGAVLVAPKT